MIACTRPAMAQRRQKQSYLAKGNSDDFHVSQDVDHGTSPGQVPISSLVSGVKSKKPRNQFSSRRSPNSGENQEHSLTRKPPINPQYNQKSTDHTYKFESATPQNLVDGTDRSWTSPQQSASAAISGKASAPSGVSNLDQHTCCRISPLLPDDSKDSGWTLNKSIHECVSLGDSELFFISKKIIVCTKNNKSAAEKYSQRAPVTSSTSVWGNMVENVNIRQEDCHKLAAEEAARYMTAEYSGRFAVVLNSPILSKLSWNAPIHLVEESALEPAPLQESVMLLLFLEKYLISSPDRLVLFFEGNTSVIACLIRLLDSSAASKSARQVLSDVHELRKENVPLAGARRYLGMLEACMQSPQMIEFAPEMTLASLRLYGDMDFVKSTESLIRVHAEIHHARGIDSTDLREPLCRRITRGAEADACLVISFIPVKLSVTVLVYLRVL